LALHGSLALSLNMVSKWKVFEYRRPSIDRFRIQIDEEKANLYRSGHSPEIEIPVRKARLSKVRLNWTKKLFEEVRLS